jgi:hypothetical protein
MVAALSEVWTVVKGAITLVYSLEAEVLRLQRCYMVRCYMVRDRSTELAPPLGGRLVCPNLCA